MMKKFVLLFLLCWLNQSGFAQPRTYPFEQIDSLQNIQKRNIIVFIHTDWCGFCQAMKAKTFKDQALVEQLNARFYFIDFNAEEKRTLLFNHRTFQYKSRGNTSGVHELAIQLGTLEGQLNYPVLCVLNERYEIIFQYAGFLNAKDFKLILDKIDN